MEFDVDSGNIKSAPIKKLAAPIAVIPIEKNWSFRLMDSGVEKAVAAAAINARQPIKLENTMRQERSLKCQLQWL